jgi:hypothetical protein
MIASHQAEDTLTSERRLGFLKKWHCRAGPGIDLSTFCIRGSGLWGPEVIWGLIWIRVVMILDMRIVLAVVEAAWMPLLVPVIPERHSVA